MASKRGGDMSQSSLISGESDVFRGIAEGIDQQADGICVLALGVKRKREEGLELTIFGKLAPARTQHFGGAIELAEDSKSGTEPDQRAGKFIGGKAEGDGFFIIRQSLVGPSKHVTGPGQLVIDFRRLRILAVEFLQARKNFPGLSVGTCAHNGIQFLFPSR